MQHSSPSLECSFLGAGELVRRPTKNRAAPIPMVDAVKYVVPLRGCSAPHLLKCSDDYYYVVKTIDNPQGPRVLANELLAAQIADHLCLPLPPYAIVHISQELIDDSPGLRAIQQERGPDCKPGLAFGSQYIARYCGGDKSMLIGTVGCLPPGQFPLVRNRDDFLGFLVFDKWTANADRRQVLFAITEQPNEYEALMVDNGFCFGGSRWRFSDSAIQGLYGDPLVYRQDLTGSMFDTWLQRLKDVDGPLLESFARQIPEEWFFGQRSDLDQLMKTLLRRKSRIGELLLGVVGSAPPQFLSFARHLEAS